MKSRADSQPLARSDNPAYRLVARFVLPYWRPLSVFVLALVLRLCYNAFVLDERICHVGDAYYFLTAGNKLLAAILGGDLVGALFDSRASTTSGIQLMTSSHLVDRLLIDGPVYPAYLALAELVSGVSTAHPDYDVRFFQLSAVNSVVDSATCLLIYYLGRVGFDRSVGWLAGIIFAVYPAAVINTQHCYAEPFAYFLTTGWLTLASVCALRHLPGGRAQTRLWLALGLMTGLVMLSRPTFILLPWVVLFAVAAVKLFADRICPPDGRLAASAAGLDVPVRPPGQPNDGRSEDVRPDGGAPAANSAPAPAIRLLGRADLPPSSSQMPAASLPPFALRPPTQSLPSWAEGRLLLPIAPGAPAAGTTGNAPPSTGARTAASMPATPLVQAPVRPAFRIEALAPRAALLLLGLVLVIGPWLLFTANATGRLSLFVNRVPSYNLFIGNFLSYDGWKALPYDYFIPADVSAAGAIIARDAASHPLEFAGLQLRKVARLWAGLWNENRYALPFAPLPFQNFLHRLMLFNALIGLVLLAGSTKCYRLSRSTTCGAMLAATVLFHFVYCAFMPLSRYNSTAMPAVALLAAYAVMEGLLRGAGRRRQFILVELAFSLVLWLTVEIGSLLPALACISTLLTPAVLCLLDGCIWVAVWSAFGYFIVRVARGAPYVVRPGLVTKLLAVGTALSALVAFAYSVADPERKEWCADVRTVKQVIRQDVFVPPMASVNSLAPVSFLLIDMESLAILPKVAVAVNGERLVALPMPWLQVLGGHQQTVDLFSLQSQTMGTDIHRFRQWWAIPVPTELINFGAANEVMIRLEDRDSPFSFRVYGDYTKVGPSESEAPKILPSFDRVAWDKGFGTFAIRDPRVYERARLLGRNADAHRYDGKDWRRDDLSESPGRQFGEYRVRLALCAKKTATSRLSFEGPVGLSLPPAAMGPFVLLAEAEPRAVVGNNPNTMMLTASPLKVPAGLPSGSMFLASLQLSDNDIQGSANLSVTFSGTDKGQPVTWSSLWQPARIPTSDGWWPTSFLDIIPDNVLGLDDLTVNVLVAPFPPDRLFMKKKQALKDSVFVRSAAVMILPPMALPSPDERNWLYY